MIAAGSASRQYGVQSNTNTRLYRSGKKKPDVVLDGPLLIKHEYVYSVINGDRYRVQTGAHNTL